MGCAMKTSNPIGSRKCVRCVGRLILMIGACALIAGCFGPDYGYAPSYPAYGYAPYSYGWPVPSYQPAFVVHHPWEDHHLGEGHHVDFYRGSVGAPHTEPYHPAPIHGGVVHH
jgi:hypothetical protein